VRGLIDRVRVLAPAGVDLALDIPGSGVLPDLIDLAGGPEHVVNDRRLRWRAGVRG
jgi:hypothetical protein